jgi:hypothetical protein
VTGEAIPSTSAYLWVLGLTLLFGGLIAMAGVAWPALGEALARRQPDQPGQILTSLDGHTDRAVQAGLVDELRIRPASPGRKQAEAEAEAWAQILAGYRRTAPDVTYQRTEQP